MAGFGDNPDAVRLECFTTNGNEITVNHFKSAIVSYAPTEMNT